MFCKGDVLCTLNSQVHTNAVVVRIVGDSYLILTDWGNLLTYSEDELRARYIVSAKYLQAKEIGYPLPTIQERVQEQINTLTNSLEALKELGIN